jgi:hypothetical protein
MDDQEPEPITFFLVGSWFLAGSFGFGRSLLQWDLNPAAGFRFESRLNSLAKNMFQLKVGFKPSRG